MLLASRIRRLKEFTDHFGNKVPEANPPAIPVGGPLEDRVVGQLKALRHFLEEHEPICYWCYQRIQMRGFLPFKEETDDYTIHHIDEDRGHNAISNLAVCHKSCHQAMHKLSQQLRLPAHTVRELRKS